MVSRIVGIKIRSGLHEYHYLYHRSMGDNKTCSLGGLTILKTQIPHTNYANANTRKSDVFYLVKCKCNEIWNDLKVNLVQHLV